ncbi:MAG TPA: lytic transglycosylase domain-containing protein [Blastocatellia bacterium]|nr:lytic transglycosylase domain-containing protein [Blastocatellia bacterium]
MQSRKLVLSSGRIRELFKSLLVLSVVAGVLVWQGRTSAPTASAESAASVFIPSCGKPEIDRLIFEAGARYGVDPRLVYYVIRQESNFRVNARSPRDAQGLMQMIPATADRFKVEDVYDPKQNIEGGVRYLRWLLEEFDGNVELALAGYNAGEGNVRKHGNRVPDFHETKNYVRKITLAYGSKYHPVLEPEEARVQFGLVQ